jgi:hypothetical protein
MRQSDKLTLVQGGLLAVVSLLGTGGLCGCLVAGYSSSGGAFIWPGGLGLLVIILLVVLLLRRRR